MTNRNDQQDQRLDDGDRRDAAQDDRLDAGDRADAAQDDRLDAGDRADAAQDRRLDAGDRADAAQDRRLDALDHDRANDGITGLPGANTPAGTSQRIKLEVPTPATTLTLGAIGNNDAAGHKFGPGGLNLRTVENFAAEVLKQTIIDSDDHTIIHTKTTLTEVAGEKIHLSTNGDYQLGTVGGVSITAAEGAGFTDPEFTVDPQMAIPAPPTIDTKGPRSATETVKDVWGVIWKMYDTFSGAKSLRDVVKDRAISKGIGKDTFAGKAAGVYSVINNGKKVYTGAMMALNACVAAFDHSNPGEKPSGPGKPKITMYSDQGITLITPEKISLFSSTGGCSVESPHKVGMKGGVSASIKAGCDATVFAFVSAKLQSKGVAAVKGKVVSVSGDLIEIASKKQMIVSSKDSLSVDADKTLRLSSKVKAQLAAPDLLVNSDAFIRVACDDVIELHAANQNNLWGDKKVFVESQEDIELKVKKTGLLMTDGDLKLGCNNEYGVHITNSKANIGSSSDYVACGNSKINIVTRGTAKVNGSTIKLG